MKLMALLLLGIIVLLLLPNPRPVVLELWEQQNTVFRVCMLLCAVIVPPAIAELSFFRLVFSESGIEQRTKFLKKEFRPYSEIEAVEYRPETIFQPGFLTITFSDLRKIKIASGLANLQIVGTILVTYGNKLIMTTSKDLRQ